MYICIFVLCRFQYRFSFHVVFFFYSYQTKHFRSRKSCTLQSRALNIFIYDAHQSTSSDSNKITAAALNVERAYNIMYSPFSPGETTAAGSHTRSITYICRYLYSSLCGHSPWAHLSQKSTILCVGKNIINLFISI